MQYRLRSMSGRLYLDARCDVVKWRFAERLSTNRAPQKEAKKAMQVVFLLAACDAGGL